MRNLPGDRKLVFWYDDKSEFAEDMETVELQNAKVYHLQPDNQFYTKYFLERVDKTTNYLIYAPFPKPDVRDNHLEDTMLYSDVSLLTVPPCCRLTSVSRRSTSRLLRSTSSFSPIKSVLSGSMIWKSRILMKKISLSVY